MGLRKRAMISGVNWIHQGPCGVDWMPSRTPDWHQSSIVETVHIEQLRRDARASSDHPPDSPRHIDAGPIGTAARNRIAISELFYDVRRESGGPSRIGIPPD